MKFPLHFRGQPNFNENYGRNFHLKYTRIFHKFLGKLSKNLYDKFIIYENYLRALFHDHFLKFILRTLYLAFLK